MHKLSSSFVLGYHGCDRAVAERLLQGEPFAHSRNDYDWLGSGIYFWEANPVRRLEFASEWASRGKIDDPYVIGAVVELGYCLDVTTSAGAAAIVAAYEDFILYCEIAGTEIPQNRGGDDRLLRNLDCAVVNHLHKVIEADNKPPFDTVKGVFIEGGPIYENSGFYGKTHIQLCVRNRSCIKGVFRVSDDQLQPV